MSGVVIIGAGQAAASFAAKCRYAVTRETFSLTSQFEIKDYDFSAFYRFDPKEVDGGRCVDCRLCSPDLKRSFETTLIEKRYAFVDGRFEVRSKGRSLPYKIFNMDQRVTHAAITDYKRLGAVLEHIKDMQDASPPKYPVRTNSEKMRYKPAEW